MPAKLIYGDSTQRLGMDSEMVYQCQNCNARVGCHKGSTRPLGNLANEVLRLKRIETHRIFDSYWRARGMSRTKAYKWMSAQLKINEAQAHIGGFEMDQCQKLIELCQSKK